MTQPYFSKNSKINRLALVVFMTFAPISCAPTISETPRIETGAETPAPGGWIDYCIRVPTDEACDD